MADVELLQAENERLREKVDEWKRRSDAYFQTAERQGKGAERLAEALRDARRALAFAAQHLPECNEPYERANAALQDQEHRNG